jgi:uncharacterized repeat protein (TIGR03803 family)
MRRLRSRPTQAIATCVLSLVLMTSALCAAQEQVLHSFAGQPDGAQPMAGLVSDTAGNLFGTTELGGLHNHGTVFELSRSGNAWKAKLVHSFTGGSDGSLPIAGLTIDHTGNLYGTTLEGGSAGVGLVFKLAHSQGAWKETVLHSFKGIDGADPSYGRLVLDKTGALYGTTQLGGTGKAGVVFRVAPSKGKWTETVLYNLTQQEYFSYGVVMDARGHLYGITLNLNGVVFELTPKQNGQWTHSVVFTLPGGNEGAFPSSGIVLDKKGNIYGTTAEGGPSGQGVVFQLAQQQGKWVENVIHVFDYGDGSSPDSLVFDAKGNLYGETAAGGTGGCTYPGCGVVFQLSPSNGEWNYSLLHSFQGTDGSVPVGGLILDSDANLYGATEVGGTNHVGVVFEVAH